MNWVRILALLAGVAGGGAPMLAQPVLAQPAPAPAPAAPAGPAGRTAAKPIDLSSYTCQDMMQDLTDKDMERIGMSIVIALAVVQTQAEPANLKFDMGLVRQLSERVGRNCGLGERSRHLLQVVADEYKSLGKPTQ